MLVYAWSEDPNPIPQDKEGKITAESERATELSSEEPTPTLHPFYLMEYDYPTTV